MADTKISALPVATAPLDPNGLVPVVIGAVTRRALIKDLAGKVAVFETATAPTATASGDLWLKPTGQPNEASLFVWNGTDWVQASSPPAALTVATDGSTSASNGYPENTFSAAYQLGGPMVVPGSIFTRYEPAYPVQDFADALDYTFTCGFDVVRRGFECVLHRIQVSEKSDFVKDVHVGGILSVAGGIRYGGTIQTIPSLTRSGEVEVTYDGGFELPPPTENGYLRSDADDKNWYFAEPIIVADAEPPAPTPDMQAAGVLWIDPGATPQEVQYSNASPPVSLDPPIEEMADGTPFGVVNNVYVEPDVVGAVPVEVNGKRYLLPLLEAPASAATRTPLFTFTDDAVKQQSDGSWIGFNDTGTIYYQPDTVGGIPVIVGGKKYLLPLIAE